jgi:3-oxoacyl-[acyl-carrier protein] reductase
VIAHCFSGSERLEALRAELGEERIRPIVADFSVPSSVVEMAARIEAEHGVPHQIVHLPGLKLVYERFPKFNREHFQRDLQIQLEAAVTLLQRFLPAMAKVPGSRVVFVLSSVTRGVPPKFLSMYTVLKYAQLGLMKALASEYAGTGVTVNAVSPSMIETSFLKNLPELAVQASARSNPLGRNAVPADIVGALAFLLSGDSGYINGVELPITAGSTG